MRLIRIAGMDGTERQSKGKLKEEMSWRRATNQRVAEARGKN